MANATPYAHAWQF